MFYSQKLNEKGTDNLCVRCEKRFDKWVDYHAHVTTAKCARVLRPINKSGRTKAQIVAAMEATTLKPYVIVNPSIVYRF